MRIDVNEPDSAEKFWEGMREVAAAATRHQDDDLFKALIKIGRSALAQGVELVPSCGFFLSCPVCSAASGQRCINSPGHPLGDDRLHPERVELARRAIRGEVPIPGPLR
ncbi:zinc finger domain-containing protein [Micromonospora sp. WMMD729]|uniref:zinc finger domain-containing protein n=1 Tax=Micromonospora sp. WMMD729 TaxID=3404127 RepID=UPI003BF4DDCB